MARIHAFYQWFEIMDGSQRVHFQGVTELYKYLRSNGANAARLLAALIVLGMLSVWTAGEAPLGA